MTIVVLGSERDYHAQHMQKAIQKRGVDAVLFDSSLYPHTHGISYSPLNGEGILCIHGKELAFGNIGAVFWSSLCPTHRLPNPVTNESLIAYHDAYTMLRCFLQYQHCFWANSWWGYDFHRVKPRQLTLASQCGAKIPDTYVGNQPEAAEAFIAAHQQVVFKPVYGGAHAALVKRELVGASHLRTVLQQSPVTLQAYIPGTNVRTFCIGEDVYSATIESDQIDFRSEQNIQPQVCDTPEHIVRLSRKIAKQFGLAWTAIDWRVTDDQQFYFLEANPSPMFIHFERCTGYPITESLIDMLLDSAHPKFNSRFEIDQDVNKSCLISSV